MENNLFRKVSVKDAEEKNITPDWIYVKRFDCWLQPITAIHPSAIQTELLKYADERIKEYNTLIDEENAGSEMWSSYHNSIGLLNAFKEKIISFMAVNS